MIVSVNVFVSLQTLPAKVLIIHIVSSLIIRFFIPMHIIFYQQTK